MCKLGARPLTFPVEACVCFGESGCAELCPSIDGGLMEEEGRSGWFVVTQMLHSRDPRP
jgi:hypothetical protein